MSLVVKTLPPFPPSPNPTYFGFYADLGSTSKSLINSVPLTNFGFQVDISYVNIPPPTTPLT